jgi:hypothetical protein
MLLAGVDDARVYFLPVLNHHLSVLERHQSLPHLQRSALVELIDIFRSASEHDHEIQR